MTILRLAPPWNWVRQRAGGPVRSASDSDGFLCLVRYRVNPGVAPGDRQAGTGDLAVAFVVFPAVDNYLLMLPNQS